MMNNAVIFGKTFINFLVIIALLSGPLPVSAKSVHLTGANEGVAISIPTQQRSAGIQPLSGNNVSALVGTTYKLPFQHGTSNFISRGGTEHDNSYDFTMPVGTKVKAVVGGVIENIVKSNDCQNQRPKDPRFDPDCKNNQIRIKQDDGKVGFYLHIKKDGILINPRTKAEFKENDRVEQGDDIALSGDVGLSSGPHLHYNIAKDGWNKVADRVLVNFIEAPADNKFLSGKKFESPKSQNGSPCPVPSADKFIFYSGKIGAQPDSCGGKGESASFEKPVPAAGTSLRYEGLTMPLESVAFPTACKDAVPPFDPNKQYKIQSASSKLFLDVGGASNEDNGAIIQWHYHGESNQRWKFITIDGTTDQYQIKAVNSDNQCLSISSDAKAIQFTCDPSNTNQRWQIVKNTNGTEYFIKSVGTSPKVLDVPAFSTSMAQIILYTENGGKNQFWKISQVYEYELTIENTTTKRKIKTYWGMNLSDMLGEVKTGETYNIEIKHIYDVCAGSAIRSSMGMAACYPIANQPPSSPQLAKPVNRYSQLHKAPTLFWNKSSDPDGNWVEYYVDIFDSPVNLKSGWLNQTYWTPSALDWKYHTYQWRVKARDSLGKESGWSETRTFTIESPNKPPLISFDNSTSGAPGAVASPAGSFLSREGTWTFTGTASDPENDLRRIEFKCVGDGCGTQAAHQDGGNWSHTQVGMRGQNEVRFIAYDGYGNNTYSRTVTLYIDQAPPTTQIGLNQAPPNPGWYTAPVVVSLRAQDGASGRSRAGVDRLYYRLDGGALQSVPGGSVDFTVSSDGSHTVDAYAEDILGNQETSRKVYFRIDQTPPEPPSGAVETGSAVSGVWQNQHNLPAFTWDPALDATSGLSGYQLYFGPDPAGIGYESFPAAAPRAWAPLPGGMRTGTYYLRGRSCDIAGNCSAWTDMFTFLYDGTAPDNPDGVTHALGVESAAWQRITSQPDFSWPVPHDEGSGIHGYQSYWGLDEHGAASAMLSEPHFSAPGGLCPGSACTGYLRLRSVDNVGNLAGEWTTAFILRYDDAPPTVDFTVNGGEGQTAQTQVTLNINAADLGSGVKTMRFSGDGITWTPWEVFAPQRDWQLPPVSRQSWPIFVQVQDGVGLVSVPFHRLVSLDVNTVQPKSANFRLFDQAQPAGSAALGSSSYRGHGTLGQPAESPVVRSASYLSWPGYEAGSLARPMIVPGHEEFIPINGAFVSGSGITVMASAAYRMSGTTGEPALPNNQPNLTSTTFRHQPGFLAAARSLRLTPEQEQGSAPEPEPEQECSVPYIRINGDALFANQPEVALSLCAPHAVEMMISNNEDLLGAAWQPYAREANWVLAGSTQEVRARFVYAAFKNADGAIFGTYLDGITLDQTQPSGALLLSDDIPLSQIVPQDANGETYDYRTFIEQVMAQADIGYAQTNPDGSITLLVDAMDNNSGLVEMQFSLAADFSGAPWEPFSPVKTWLLPDETDGIKTAYARFRDSAGNVSDPSPVTFLVDRRAPYGGAWFEQATARPEVRQLALTLYAGDRLVDEDTGDLLEAGSGVTEMRLGELLDLAGAVWQPYRETVIWPVELEGVDGGEVYVQFRDQAGNVSAIESAAYLVDIAGPQVWAVVNAGSGLNRVLEITAWDDRSTVSVLYLSSDPRMLEAVTRLDYSGGSIPWTFDDQRVVWIQAEDSAGNRSAVTPLFAEDNGINVYLPVITR